MHLKFTGSWFKPHKNVWSLGSILVELDKCKGPNFGETKLCQDIKICICKTVSIEGSESALIPLQTNLNIVLLENLLWRGDNFCFNVV